MCIIPDGEFIAPFDIEAVKIVRLLINGGRMSQYIPSTRINKYGGTYQPTAFSGGADLEYPKGIVDSPGGPGIHVWFGREKVPYDFICNEGSINVIIPRGTRVSYQKVFEDEIVVYVLAADTIIVVS